MSVEERFWSKVLIGDGCWEWIACKSSFGHGGFKLDGKMVGAHIMAYCLWNKVKQNDLACVLHRCDNPGCVRPDHLFQGSQLDNNKDKAAKNRCNVSWSIKIPESELQNIIELYKGGLAQRQIAIRYDVSKSQIQRIVNRQGRKSFTCQ